MSTKLEERLAALEERLALLEAIATPATIDEVARARRTGDGGLADAAASRRALSTAEIDRINARRAALDAVATPLRASRDEQTVRLRAEAIEQRRAEAERRAAVEAAELARLAIEPIGPVSDVARAVITDRDVLRAIDRARSANGAGPVIVIARKVRARAAQTRHGLGSELAAELQRATIALRGLGLEVDPDRVHVAQRKDGDWFEEYAVAALSVREIDLAAQSTAFAAHLRKPLASIRGELAVYLAAEEVEVFQVRSKETTR